MIRKGGLLLLLLCMILVSCDKDEKQTLTVSEAELLFDNAGGQKSIDILSNTNWILTGIPDWCTVNTSKGQGNAVLEFSVSANEGTELREAKLTVTAEGIQREILIRQQVKEATGLELSTTILHFINQSCERKLEIKTDGAWKISGLPDWCTVDKDQGLGNATVRFRVSSNEADVQREADLIVSAGTYSEKERIRQIPLSAIITGTTLNVIKPGSLIDFLPYADELQGITRLTITWKINVMDISQMQIYKSLSQLTSIDMKTVQIEKSHPLGESGSSEDYMYADNEFSGLAGFKTLQSIVLPESITKIAFNAFKKCEGLTLLTIPNRVTTIDLMAFEECRNLQIIYLSARLNYLGEAVFFYCNNLKEVHIANPTPPTLDTDAFEYSSVPSCTLYVPKGSKATYENSGWNRFKAIVEE